MLDTPKSGYISALISNERIKFFTVSGTRTAAADSGNVQQTKGYRLKLTQAGANYVNRALRKKALKRFSQFGTLDVRLIQPASSAVPQPGGPGAPTTPGTPGTGDGTPEVTVLALEDVDVDLDSNTGTVKLKGGLIIDLPALACMSKRATRRSSSARTPASTRTSTASASASATSTPTRSTSPWLTARSRSSNCT